MNMLRPWFFYVLVILIVLLTAGGVILWSFYGPSAEQAAISAMEQEGKGASTMP